MARGVWRIQLKILFAQATKGKTNFIKIKHFCVSRALSKKCKDHPQNGIKYLQITDLTKVECPKYIENL